MIGLLVDVFFLNLALFVRYCERKKGSPGPWITCKAISSYHLMTCEGGANTSSKRGRCYFCLSPPSGTSWAKQKKWLDESENVPRGIFVVSKVGKDLLSSGVCFENDVSMDTGKGFCPGRGRQDFLTSVSITRLGLWLVVAGIWKLLVWRLDLWRTCFCEKRKKIVLKSFKDG